MSASRRWLGHRQGWSPNSPGVTLVEMSAGSILIFSCCIKNTYIRILIYFVKSQRMHLENSCGPVWNRITSIHTWPILVLRAVTPWWLVGRCQRFGIKYCLLLQGWRWRRQVPPNCWYAPTRLHDIITQKSSRLLWRQRILRKRLRLMAFGTGHEKRWMSVGIVESNCTAILRDEIQFRNEIPIRWNRKFLIEMRLLYYSPLWSMSLTARGCIIQLRSFWFSLQHSENLEDWNNCKSANLRIFSNKF
jgi:hypothetical protein